MPQAAVRAVIALGCFLLAACAPSVETVLSPTGDGASMPITVYTPPGKGPFPAVVLMHHCGGIRTVTVEWRQRLVNWGYVVAVPDSFTPRGYPEGVCSDGSKVTYLARAQDAYAALHLLERRPDVIADRIALMGHSHGAVAVLGTVSDAISTQARALSGADRNFHAAIAFYPWCGDRAPITFGNGPAYRTAVPLLILAGELDDWDPAGPCADMTAGAQRIQQPVQITVYPRAHHGFDSQAPVTRVPEALRGKGATVGGDPTAREDSIRRSREFLAQHLLVTR